MNYWDILPDDIKLYIFKLNAIKIIKNNWRRHPAIRSIYIAKATLERCGLADLTINIDQSNITWALKYIIKYSKYGDLAFWNRYCYYLIDVLCTFIYFDSICITENTFLDNKRYIYMLVNKYYKKILNTNNDLISNDDNDNIDHSYILDTLHTLSNILEKNKIFEFQKCLPWIL
jgi:hypothetical protein